MNRIHGMTHDMIQTEVVIHLANPNSLSIAFLAVSRSSSKNISQWPSHLMKNSVSS